MLLWGLASSRRRVSLLLANRHANSLAVCLALAARLIINAVVGCWAPADLKKISRINVVA